MSEISANTWNNQIKRILCFLSQAKTIKCPHCHGTGKIEVIDKEKIRQYIIDNVKPGSIINLSGHPRKVIDVSWGDMLTLQKLYTPNDTTVYNFTDYYKKFRGIIKQ